MAGRTHARGARLSWLAGLALVVVPGGCGGGGGGGDSGGGTITPPTPPEPRLTVSSLQISGAITEPAAGQVATVTVDGVAATVTGDTWTATIPFDGRRREVQLIKRLDGVAQSSRLVVVSAE